MSYIGIDYGLGQSNVDKETGIRYGVISQHTVGQAWYDDAEADYDDPKCPKCGGDVVEAFKVNNDGERWPRLYSHGVEDYACEICEHYLDSGDVYGEEPLGWFYTGDGYELHDAFDNTEIFVLKSPFYTFAQFCSPCAPGAGNLNHPMEDGAKTYCLGHDWFEERKAPYPVYSVATGELVQPE